jgi:hypothetical protein
MYVKDPLNGGWTSIVQWIYNTGQLEVRTFTSYNGIAQPAAPNLTTPSGLSIINGNLYLIGYNVYEVDLTAPYSKTLIQTPGTQIVNSSQLVECSTVSLTRPSCGFPTVANPYNFDGGLPPLNAPNTVTYNGITISASGTGLADNMWPYWYNDTALTDCPGYVGTPYQSVGLGANPFNPGLSNYSFSYTMNFSQPVNNIKLYLSALDNGETFTFTSNGGSITITSNNNCSCYISGNIIITNEINGNIPGSGIFLISAPSAFTTLTVTGPGGQGGTTMGIDCSTVIPAPVVSPSPSISPSPSLTPTPTPSTSPITNPLGCVYYSSNNNTYNYNPIVNTSTQVTLPGDTFTSFAEAHTSTKYWKGNQTNTIKEWIPTNDPTILAFNRDITISGITSAFGNYFTHLQAIDNTTLLTTIVNSQPTPAGGFTTSLIRLDITNNIVTPLQMTTLFNIYAPAGLDSILLTSTNKLITVGRRNTPSAQDVHYLSQYSYPNGVLELDIDISSIVSNTVNTQVYVFESNGNLYLSVQFPYPLSTLYVVNLNSPYTLTPIYTDMNLFGAIFNSSINCTTVNLILPPIPSPSPTPSPSAPSNAFRTIYKYLDIQ